MFSWPLSSGARGGSGTSETLLGTTSALAINDYNVQRLDQLLPWNWKTTAAKLAA
jgi:hypothetical protein